MKTKNQFTNRILSLVLAFMMVIGMLPMNTLTAFAAPGYSYIDADGSSKSVPSATEITSSTTTWNSGWYYVGSNVEIDSRITVSGDVKLILGAGYTLEALQGIWVSDSNTLTIYSQATVGELIAYGSEWNAAIGGNGKAGTSGANVDSSVGTIIINGGNVTAIGGKNGAGIGSGWGGAGGSITVNGGNVTATGGKYGAGIGSSQNAINNISITITGGNVNATGGTGAASIGTGYGAEANNAAIIHISGGNITAAERNWAEASIGNGVNSDSATTVSITGGVIDAELIGNYSGGWTAEITEISGTTFLKDPSAYIIKGQYAEKDTDGKYHVRWRGAYISGISQVNSITVMINGNVYAISTDEYRIIDGTLYLFVSQGDLFVTVNDTDYYGIYSGNSSELQRYYKVIDLSTIPTAIDANTAYELVTTVTPENALNQTFSYEVTDAGTTGAILNGNILTAPYGGELTLKATAKDSYKTYSKTFTIKVTQTAVTGISGDDVIPTTADSVPITLPTDVLPTTATHKTIVWSVIEGSAVISNGILKFFSAGECVVRATVKNGIAYGEDYTKDYKIKITAASAIDVSQGDIVFSKQDENTMKVTFGNGQQMTFSAKQTPAVTGSSDRYRIIIESGSPNLILRDCNISVTGSAAMSIHPGASAEITLVGTNKLEGYGGIHVPSGASLSIDGTGTLTAISVTSNEAGIGGGFKEAGGTITINDGMVTATSSGDGAGIGGGVDGAGGEITISGGTVTATSDGGGAGIGGGSGGAGGTITINDGMVTATSSGIGAGIGGGADGAGGEITISGGTVTATSDGGGAGIGGGSGGAGGTITINGGTVTATSSQEGSGIGGGSDGAGVTIKITGGTVNATSTRSGAGIGGRDGIEITISGGTVTAASNTFGGAGIGGAVRGNNITVTISGGTITATSGEYGAGIGGGNYGNNITVTISGGTVTATGGKYGAGIGGGWDGEGGSVIVTGGNIKAVPGSRAMAIGAGEGGSSFTLTNGEENVSLNKIILNSAEEDSEVTAVTGMTYGLKDVKTLDTNILYFYLPSGTAATTITAGGTVYDCVNGSTYYPGHNLAEASCIKAKECINCGLTEGEPLGHNYVDGFCTRCGLDENGVYHIKTAEQLTAFANLVNEGNTTLNAILMNDIDMSGITFYPIAPITTLNYSTSNYTELGYEGTFDGGGHTISNLTITRNTNKAATVGLFGTVSGTVKNLHLDNASYTRVEDVDGRFSLLVGQLLPGGTITNCIVSNSTMEMNDNYIAGAIAGCNYGGTIENCVSYNNSINAHTRCGNLVGDNQNDGKGSNLVRGTVNNCYSTSTLAGGNGGSGTVTGSEANVSTDRFASGEIAYKLNGSTSEGDLAWGQTIGEDAYPVLGGATVYYDTTNGYNNHVHEWEYTVDGNTISANCTATDCLNPNGGRVTLTAPTGLVYGDGKTTTASVTGSFTTGAGTPEPTYQYKATEDGTYAAFTGTPANAGWYKATISVANTNGDPAVVSVEYQIGKADPTVPADLTAVYGQKLSDIELPDGWSWVNGDTPVTVNTTTYPANFAGDANYNAKNAVDITVSIAPKEVTNPVIEGIDAQYLHTGAAITPVPTAVKDGDTVIDPSEYTVSWENNTDVGTATVIIKDNEGGNYTVNGSTTFQIVVHAHVWNYTVSGATIMATCSGNMGDCPVTNKTVTITLNAPENLTYDGTEKVVTVEQSPANVFTDLPAEITGEWIDAGEYTAELTYGEKTATLTFTIVPKELSIQIVPYPYYKDYDGTNALTDFYIMLPGIVDEDEDVYVDDSLIVELTDCVPGEYTTAKVSNITLIGEDAGNYTIVSEIEEVSFDGTFTIDKADLSIIPEDQYLPENADPDPEAYTVKGLPEDHTLSGVKLVKSEDGKYIEVDPDENIVITNAAGVDVTEYFEIDTYETGKVIPVCDGHSFNEYGFCATGICQTYQPAVKTVVTDADGYEEDCYLISNAGQLYWYAQQLNENNLEIHVKLAGDIIIPESYESTDNGTVDVPDWTPINSSYAYFDGNFKTISGLRCTDTEATYVGMFGNEGWWYEISNLHITDSYFEGNNYVGAVVANLGNGGSVTNCYVTNTTVKGDGYVGTLVGHLGVGHVINCYVDTDTLVGYHTDGYGSIENSYYLSDTDDGNGGKTAEQFASGEVAWLLNGDQSNIVWKQTIGTDDFPNFTGLTVYYDETNGYFNEDDSEVVSVTITWGAMEFTYIDGDWQPESHTYADGEWEPDADGYNVITVENTGTVAVNVSFAYSKIEEEVAGSFTDENGNAITSPVALAVEEEKTIQLILSGKPSSTMDKQELGTVTVTISVPENP